MGRPFRAAAAWTASGLFSFPPLAASLSAATNGRSEAARSCLPGPLSTARPSLPAGLCPEAPGSGSFPAAPCAGRPWVSAHRGLGGGITFPPRLREVVLTQGHTASKWPSQNRNSDVCDSKIRLPCTFGVPKRSPEEVGAGGGSGVRDLGRILPDTKLSGDSGAAAAPSTQPCACPGSTDSHKPWAW